MYLTCLRAHVLYVLVCVLMCSRLVALGVTACLRDSVLGMLACLACLHARELGELGMIACLLPYVVI